MIKSKFLHIPLILSGISIIPIVLVRPQLFSFLFFTLILVLFFNRESYLKYRFFLPFLFLLWANLHGGFLFGLFFYAVFIFVNFLKRRTQSFDLIILFISAALTFINPYGFDLWKEVLHSGSDLSLRLRIQEWMPTFFFINYGLTVLTVLAVVVFIKYFKKFNLFEKVSFILLFLFGMSSERNITFFIPIAALVLVKGFDYFYRYLKNKPFNLKRFFIVYKLFFIFCFILLFFTLMTETFSVIYSPTLRVLIVHPKAAVSYLKTHQTKGQIFSVYPWGGFLIWKMPQKKVFIDGRMPSWQNPLAPSSESKDAFLEMQDIGSGRVLIKEEIKKYNIDTFLLPSNSAFSNDQSLESRAIKNILNINQFNGLSLLEQLKALGFKVVYKDNIALIFRKS